MKKTIFLALLTISLPQKCADLRLGISYCTPKYLKLIKSYESLAITWMHLSGKPRFELYTNLDDKVLPFSEEGLKELIQIEIGDRKKMLNELSKYESENRIRVYDFFSNKALKNYLVRAKAFLEIAQKYGLSISPRGDDTVINKIYFAAADLEFEGPEEDLRALHKRLKQEQTATK